MPCSMVSTIPRSLAGAVPPDDGLGVHNDQHAVPIWLNSAREHPEAAVDIRDPWPLCRALKDCELLPKRQILKGQRAARFEGRDE